MTPLPTVPGAYRWYYADAVVGEWTAVAIFMVGAVFSYRASVGARRGDSPHRHCAVNFALYRRGVRQRWVFSEYPGVSDGDGRLRIGRSWFEQRGDRAELVIDDAEAPKGGRVQARLVLTAACPEHPEVELVPGQSHRWQPLMARATARLEVPAFGVAGEGHGYLDTNHGDSRLGDDLQGWVWSRAHGPQETQIDYRPFGARTALRVRAGSTAVGLERVEAPSAPTRLSAWGMKLPREAPGTLLEHSPFYARLEGERGASHVMTEVADFTRFHRPWIRWMSLYRSREGVVDVAA